MSLQARLALVVGKGYRKTTHWPGPCTGGLGGSHWASHEAAGMDDWDLWSPIVCDGCGQPAPAGLDVMSTGEHSVYDTPSGKLEPGCLYWADWLDHDGHCLFWDNCDGLHLMAVCPNGAYWDIDSRASNCGSPNDRVHRCWIRHGEAPNVHVDKNGLTCSAGAGSIQAGDYHGFLHNGSFT